MSIMIRGKKYCSSICSSRLPFQLWKVSSSTMVEVSEIGLKEEEVELDLGLSLGGSFGRSEKTTTQPVSKPNGGIELSLKEHQHQAWRDNGKPEGLAVMDPQRKREIHALRRLEARKKQQNKRLVREPQSELDHQQRPCKRERTDRNDDGGSEYLKGYLNSNGAEKQLGVGRGVAVGSPVSFQHHPCAYVQLNSGYACPCVVPWTVKEKNAGQPAAACKGSRPFRGNGYGSDPNGERDWGDNNKKAKSDGSSMCSSSVVSDHQSSSHEGSGGSSDGQSQSVQSLAEPSQLMNGSSQNHSISQLPEQTASSHHPIKSDHNIAQQQNPNRLPDRETDPGNRLEGGEPMKKHAKDMVGMRSTKPPRPHQPPPPPPRSASPPSSSSSHLLTKLPYVSTTGNGPNGKRVNGFLYRYSNSEVSIVCVCHGSTFSPAGFVQHAGGTDMSHPEKHITVIPPAFGSNIAH